MQPIFSDRKGILIVVTLVLTLFVTFPVQGETELSVMDGSVFAKLIVGSDFIHFVVQVQANQEILYSNDTGDASFIELHELGGNMGHHFHPFNSTLTEEPFPNFFRLHYYLDTTNMSGGDWKYQFHVQLIDGTLNNETQGEFTIREFDNEPQVHDMTINQITSGETLNIEANISDMDGDEILWAGVNIDGNITELEFSDNTFGAEVGPISPGIKNFTYMVDTGRKRDGDLAHYYQETFDIVVIDNGEGKNDTLPVVEDVTILPEAIYSFTDIEFRVLYMDREGDGPIKIEVAISNATNDSLTIKDTLLTQGGQFDKGEYFEKKVRLSELGMDMGPGEMKYHIIYNYKGHDLTTTDIIFNILSAPTLDVPEVIDQSTLPGDDGETLDFRLQWNYFIPPDNVFVELRVKGTDDIHELTAEANSNNDEFSISTTMEELGMDMDKCEYRFHYYYRTQTSYEETTEWKLLGLEKVGSKGEDGGQTGITIIVVLIAIIILLSLFVFTFGKRDPY